jgi:hypothetical protein
MISVNSLLSGIFFTGAGGLGLATVLRDITRARKSQTWPVVDGEVIHSAVESKVNWGAKGMPTRWSTPRVQYRYQVGGKQYTGSRVFFGGPLTLPVVRQPVARVVDKYQKGRAVKVRVSPTHPHVSVLEPGPTWYSYLAGAGMAAFLGVGLLLLRSLFR